MWKKPLMLRLHLFEQKYSENSHVTFFYLNIFKNVIYSYDAK